MDTQTYMEAVGLRPMNPKQTEFLIKSDEYDYTLTGGGIGSGKTIVLCLKLVEWATKYPSTYFLGRSSYKSLSMTTEKVWRELLIPGILADYNKQDAKYTLWSAGGMVSEVYLVHFDSWQHLMGANLGGFAIDQAEEVPEDVVTQLMGRLRHRLGPRKGIFTANPSPGYLKRWFIDDPQKGFGFISTQTGDNKYLPEGYEAGLRRFWPEAVARRYLDGSWESLEGSIYPSFSKAVHVIPPFEIPIRWTRAGGLDYGFRNPTAVLWAAINDEGDIIVYDEYYESNALPERQAMMIKAKGPVLYIAADPTIRNRQGITGTSVQQEYLDRGLPIVQGNNDVSAGIARVGQFLDWAKDESGNFVKKPKIYIFSHCTNLIRELANYHWKDVQPGQTTDPQEKPAKVDDHAADALRYLIMSRPAPEGAYIPVSPHEQLLKQIGAQGLSNIPWPLQDPAKDGVGWYEHD